MKIAVVDVLARASGKRYSTFDVVGAGPRHVAGIAEKYGDVSLFPYEKTIRDPERLKKFNIVMLSAMSFDYGALKHLTSRLRKSGFKGLLVVGGPISFEYTKLLVSLDIDYVIVGEGEIPTDKLLEVVSEGSNNFDSVPALAYRSNGYIKLTSRHLYTPKDILARIKPWTRVDEAFDHPQVYRFYVEVLRGCSNYYRPMLKELSCIECYKCRSPELVERLNCPADIPPGCGFCSVPYMFGPVRSRPLASIVKEVEELLSRGARRIVLSAPDFLDYMREELVDSQILTDPCHPQPNIDAIEELLNAIYSIDIVREGKAVVMIENIKACLVSEEVSKVLGKYLRGTTVHIGLETGCNAFNEKVLGKPIRAEHVIKACKLLRESGLRPYVYIMHSLPFTTRDVYVKTIKCIEKLQAIGVEKITLYKFVNLPCTAFENIAPTLSSTKEVALMKKLVNKYNTLMKKKMLEGALEVYILESGGRLYGYPVKHGPVVFIKERPARLPNLSGRRALVRIVDVKPRYVVGVIDEILDV